MPALDRAAYEFKKAPADAYWALRICADSYKYRDPSGLALYIRLSRASRPRILN